MTRESAPAFRKTDTAAILRKGQFFILDDYALREEMYEKVVTVFLDGIEKIESRDCRNKVATAGLSEIHRHFPVEKVRLLESFVLKRLRNDLYYWTYRVGLEQLGLERTFFVDHLILIRIHYPFLVARRAQNVLEPPYPFPEKLNLGIAALKNWRILFNLLDRVGRDSRDRRLSQHDPDVYHKRLPVPARAHGPHIDTWYGHSYGGVNLWWSIDGVNEDNTVILYPDLFGQPLAYDPQSMYVAKEIPLTKPYKIVLRPSQLLLFNPEVLHSTQVNISDSTRIAISTRLNPDEPHFDVNAPFHREHWHSSRELARRRFSSIRLFSITHHAGHPPAVERSDTKARRTAAVRVCERLRHGEPVAICASAELCAGDKLAVDLPNAKVLLLRARGTLRAFGRICPHLGIDLADGHHDDEQVYCPGHGVAYSLADGSSRCEAFKLRQYHAFEADGKIYLQRLDGDVS